MRAYLFPAIYFAFILILGFTLVQIDRRYPILRDIDPTSKLRKTNRSFSLARVQMAFWTVLVASSLLVLLSKYWFGHAGTSPLQELSTGVVALLGISGATGIVSGGIDANKDGQVQAAKNAIVGGTDAIANLDRQIVAQQVFSNQGAIAVAAQNIQRLQADRATKLTELSGHASIVSRQRRNGRTVSFFADLLTDENGNSLHRVQLILFTLFYGAYFVGQVITKHSLDISFSEQALALMGVAGGTYLGFKIPGKPT